MVFRFIDSNKSISSNNIIFKYGPYVQIYKQIHIIMCVYTPAWRKYQPRNLHLDEKEEGDVMNEWMNEWYECMMKCIVRVCCSGMFFCSCFIFLLFFLILIKGVIV